MDRRPEMPPLRRAELDPDPLVEFGRWFEAAAARAEAAEAACLATVDAAGHPDARMVLLKGFGGDGFRFFTNRDSAKGRQLASNPVAALVFHWPELNRQVRVRGSVAPLSGADSDAYFATRPRDSQIGAWASPQSRVLESGAELDGRAAAARARFGEREVERPPHWGGYLLAPFELELWQGRSGRLHDRFLYSRTEDGWDLVRLAP